ncbi:MAG TPA: ATP-binding protein [Candidatus Polarisedimenticolaceae bacterium]|nr:ATP-binding protein [Candidatus Polarisedimenticolaceae bacterium]
MAVSRRLSPGATAYVWAVVVLGAAVCANLVLGGDPAGWNGSAILLFGSLGVLATAVSFSYQGVLPSIIVHQIGTSFAYALFFIVDPGAVACVLLVMATADWALNRRRPLTAVFNMGQLMVALGAATTLRAALRPGLHALSGVDPLSVLTALASLVAFFVVNHLLTHVVISLASRRPLLRLDAGTRSGLLNEVFCIVSGLAMAVLWWVRPWLSVLGVLPIWVLILLMVRLAKREAQLEAGQAELRSLQGLGLEIGSELDPERLRGSVVRIASEALSSRGAFLAVLDGSRAHLEVLAHHGLTPPPPETLPLPGYGDDFLEAGQIRLVQDLTDAPAWPAVAFLGRGGLLCAPLQILGKRCGLLVLHDGEGRRPFDERDVRRLETLVRFVDVALSNSQLLTDVRQVQAQLVHTEKMSALGMLVSGVAHELNNPLTSVKGYAQLLLQREEEPAQARMLTKIAAETDRAAKIVQNLLTFSRKRTTEKTPTDLNRVIEQVIELREYDLRVANLTIVRDLAPSLPPVLADADQIQQVLLNLITNAEHAIREAERPGRITVSSRVLGGRVRVEVADDGRGIAPENLKRIFVPFFTTKEIGRGTGLGLSICYGIVQDHNGTIEVDSVVGRGATFRLEFPILSGAALPEEAASETAAPAPAAGVGRLLVVDDEEAIAELVRDVLEPEGWEVRTARDGMEALARVREDRFDVLLVDMRMPGMDGREFYEALRDRFPHLAQRVVFATGDAGNDGTSQFLEDVGTPLLGKPYDLRALVEVVSNVARTGGVAA